MAAAYEELIATVKDTSLLRSTAAILGWDQRTKMPPGGVEHRSKQMAQLARHDPREGHCTSDRELISECETDNDLVSDPHSDAAANLRELRRSYDRSTKLPADLVEEMARTRSVAEHEWEQARAEVRLLALRALSCLRTSISSRRASRVLRMGPLRDEAWDALAEGYEVGMRARERRGRLLTVARQASSADLRPAIGLT